MSPQVWLRQHQGHWDAALIIRQWFWHGDDAARAPAQDAWRVKCRLWLSVIGQQVAGLTLAAGSAAGGRRLRWVRSGEFAPANNGEEPRAATRRIRAVVVFM